MTSAGARPSGLSSRLLDVDGRGAFALIGETLALGRELWLVAAGESMYPVIPSGSRVLLAPRGRQVRVGDIVLVRRGESLVLHRVRATDGLTLITQGDAWPAADPPLPVSASVGFAVACDDGRGVRPVGFHARWFGVAAAARALRVSAHRFARRWRR